MNFKQNHVIWIALAIPVVMIVLVAASIYIPRFNTPPPHYNFLYALTYTGDAYTQGYYYIVKDGHLQKEKTPDLPKDYVKPLPASVVQVNRLYLHDVPTNTSREVTFEEATKLLLDPNLEAKDGYEIQSGSGGGVFPFFEGNNYDSRYLVKGNNSQKLNVKASDPRGYASFQFLGWVLE